MKSCPSQSRGGFATGVSTKMNQRSPAVEEVFKPRDRKSVRNQAAVGRELFLFFLHICVERLCPRVCLRKFSNRRCAAHVLARLTKSLALNDFGPLRFREVHP
jgi:hypothetical protein